MARLRIVVNPVVPMHAKVLITVPWLRLAVAAAAPLGCWLPSSPLLASKRQFCFKVALNARFSDDFSIGSSCNVLVRDLPEQPIIS